MLCLGAHSDDIEIGAGGTILGWIAAGVRLDVHWCVLSAAGAAAQEASGLGRSDSSKGRVAPHRARRVPRRLLPLSGRRDQGLDREHSKTRCNPDVVLHPPQRRRAPGSPGDLAADLERVPRPSRSWNTRFPNGTAISASPMSICRMTEEIIRAQVEAARDLHFGIAALEGLVRRRDLSRPGPAARHGVSRTGAASRKLSAHARSASPERDDR